MVSQGLRAVDIKEAWEQRDDRHYLQPNTAVRDEGICAEGLMLNSEGKNTGGGQIIGLLRPWERATGTRQCEDDPSCLSSVLPPQGHSSMKDKSVRKRAPHVTCAMSQRLMVFIKGLTLTQKKEKNLWGNKIIIKKNNWVESFAPLSPLSPPFSSNPGDKKRIIRGRDFPCWNAWRKANADTNEDQTVILQEKEIPCHSKYTSIILRPVSSYLWARYNWQHILTTVCGQIIYMIMGCSTCCCDCRCVCMTESMPLIHAAHLKDYSYSVWWNKDLIYAWGLPSISDRNDTFIVLVP